LVGDQVHHRIGVADEIGEHLGSGSIVEVIGIGEVVEHVDVMVLAGQHDQLVGVSNRKRAEKEGVYHAEDGASDADAEPERRHRDGGEPGALAQQPSGIAQVREDRFHCP
jgi:hypothetical protein